MQYLSGDANKNNNTDFARRDNIALQIKKSNLKGFIIMKTEKNTPGLSFEARELKLYAENLGSIYPQYLNICRNLNKHNKRKTFNFFRAAEAFMPWLATAARLYCRDFGSLNDKYFTIFPRADRYAVAVALAEEYQEKYISGEFSFLDAE